jgi:uncharacterized protein
MPLQGRSQDKERGAIRVNIKISVGPLTVEATLNDTVTAKKIAAVLPIRSTFSTWGDEIYFGIPVTAELEAEAQEVVQVGDLGYWPPGKAFCIFFGQTPASQPGKIMPVSAVNVIGRVIGDATRFKAVMRQREIVIVAD